MKKHAIIDTLLKCISVRGARGNAFAHRRPRLRRTGLSTAGASGGGGTERRSARGASPYPAARKVPIHAGNGRGTGNGEIVANGMATARTRHEKHLRTKKQSGIQGSGMCFEAFLKTVITFKLGVNSTL